MKTKELIERSKAHLASTCSFDLAKLKHAKSELLKAIHAEAAAGKSADVDFSDTQLMEAFDLMQVVDFLIKMEIKRNDRKTEKHNEG